MHNSIVASTVAYIIVHAKKIPQTNYFVSSLGLLACFFFQWYAAINLLIISINQHYRAISTVDKKSQGMERALDLAFTPNLK